MTVQTFKIAPGLNEQWLTVDDLMDYMATPGRHLHQGATDSHFCDGVTPDNIEHKLATYELPASVERIRSLLTEDVSLDTTKTRARRRNHRKAGTRVGDALEYERFDSGITQDQRFWEDRERIERRHSGRVTINCYVNLSAGERAAKVEPRGAVALALTDLLEGIGYRVRLNAVWETRFGYAAPGSKDEIVLRGVMTLKDNDERLTNSMAAWVCTNGFKRCAWHSFNDNQRDICPDSGMGRNTEGYHGLIANEPHTINVPLFQNEQDAAVFVRNIMDEYTGETR